jgi:hypothetical protein
VEKYNKPIPRCTRDETVLKTILAVLVLILITGVIILSWVPPVSRDALIHHLALPKLYLKHGGVYEIPFMSFSYYPMNIDFLYLIPLYFGSDIVPKFIHFGFALLTAWLIFYYLRCRINQAYAMVGVVFFQPRLFYSCLSGSKADLVLSILLFLLFSVGWRWGPNIMA